MKSVLVTGAAGFIGYHTCKSLLDKGYTVVGIDNINDYYDINLKLARLEQLGIQRVPAKEFNIPVISETYKEQFEFVRINLEDRDNIQVLFKKFAFTKVCHLAAQAGVRYSLENPEAYVDSNVVGFLNILEACRHNQVEHLIYASSSSVYGDNNKIPFSEEDRVDHPISLYAATKKSNELMAYTYGHLYGLRTTGLRFFTVYGPWGRPDMAMLLFTEAILKGEPIKVFNEGNLQRDFTYIDDIVTGVVKIIEDMEFATINQPYKLYNIGNGKPVKLLDFVRVIEEVIGKKAVKKMMPMQPGDVTATWADVGNLKRDYDYSPNTPVTEGIKAFINWYRTYYKV